MSVTGSCRRLNARYGSPVTVRHITGQSYNVTTGTNTPTTSDAAVNATVQGYNPRDIGGIIRQGDRKVIVAAADISFAPVAQDQVQMDGRWYTVISVYTRFVLGTAAVHILQVRG